MREISIADNAIDEASRICRRDRRCHFAATLTSRRCHRHRFPFHATTLSLADSLLSIAAMTLALTVNTPALFTTTVFPRSVRAHDSASIVHNM
jgi:hypothetical protein